VELQILCGSVEFDAHAFVRGLSLAQAVAVSLYGVCDVVSSLDVVLDDARSRISGTFQVDSADAKESRSRYSEGGY
jgi:hypothetical protein